MQINPTKVVRGICCGMLILLTSCGQVCERDPHLNYLYKAFLKIVPMQEQNVCSIQYADAGLDAIGLATSDSITHCDIRIRPGLSEFTLKAVVAHEAVHCLGYDHTDLPAHIMNPNVATEKYLEKHLDEMYTTLLEYVAWDIR